MSDLPSVSEELGSSAINDASQDAALVKADDKETKRRKKKLAIWQKGLTNAGTALDTAISLYTASTDDSMTTNQDLRIQDFRNRLLEASVNLKRLMTFALDPSLNGSSPNDSTACLSLTPLDDDEITRQIVLSAKAITEMIPEELDVTSWSETDRIAKFQDLLKEVTNLREWLFARNAVQDVVNSLSAAAQNLPVARRHAKEQVGDQYQSLQQTASDAAMSKFIFSMTCLGLGPGASLTNPDEGRKRTLSSAKKHRVPLGAVEPSSFFNLVKDIWKLNSNVRSCIKESNASSITSDALSTSQIRALSTLLLHHNTVSVTERLVEFYNEAGAEKISGPLFTSSELSKRVEAQKRGASK